MQTPRCIRVEPPPQRRPSPSQLQSSVTHSQLNFDSYLCEFNALKMELLSNFIPHRHFPARLSLCCRCCKKKKKKEIAPIQQVPRFPKTKHISTTGLQKPSDVLRVQPGQGGEQPEPPRVLLWEHPSV